MRPFNLAETRIAERTFCRDQISHRLRMIVMLTTAALLVATICIQCKTSVRGKAARTQLQLVAAQGRCSRIRREIATVRAKSDQRKWQQSLADGSERWIGALADVLSRIPEDMWLSRLESSESSSSISVEGQTRSFASLSQFAGAVRSSPRFSEAIIKNTRVATGTPVVVDFSLQIKLKIAATADAQVAASPEATAAPAVPPVEEVP